MSTITRTNTVMRTATRHSQEHDHDHGHSHDTGRAATLASHVHGRGLKEITKIIQPRRSARRPSRRRSQSSRRWARRGQDSQHPTSRRFTSTKSGAVDAIVDIVCAAVGAEALGVDGVCLLAAERRRRNGEVRARSHAGARTGDRRIAERRSDLFFRQCRRSW